MVVRHTPPETSRRTRGTLLWLLMGLIFFAMLVGLVLALDWIEPQGSRLLLDVDKLGGRRLRSAPFFVELRASKKLIGAMMEVPHARLFRPNSPSR